MTFKYYYVPNIDKNTSNAADRLGFVSPFSVLLTVNSKAHRVK